LDRLPHNQHSLKSDPVLEYRSAVRRRVSGSSVLDCSRLSGAVTDREGHDHPGKIGVRPSHRLEVMISDDRVLSVQLT
jgi:hypothetical protein